MHVSNSAEMIRDTSASITMLDLFSGVGGLSTGFKQGNSSYEAVVAVELEPRAAAGYRHNHVGTEVFDLSIQDWLEHHVVPAVDVVIGGPPCQGFSTLGQRDQNDERNSLWWYYAEAVRLAKPKYFVLENVPQFRTSAQFQLFQAMTEPGGVLSDYSIDAEVLNAADYGAAQVRKRVIVIGHRRDLPVPGFPEPTRKSPNEWQTVKDVIGGLGPVSALPGNRDRQENGKSFAGPYLVNELHVSRNYAPISLQRFRAIPPGGNRFDLPEDLKSNAWKEHTTGSWDVMGRLHWNKPSVTIRTEFTKPEKGRYVHPTEHRAITPCEAALLQGFPKGYKFLGPMTEIVKQIGNAVPIPLGSALGRHIASELSR